MAIINGSAFNDNNTVNGVPLIFRSSLIGTSLNDIINGFAGDDRLFGLAGNDRLNGGTGTDVLYGGAGNDTLRGGTGRDTLYGGSGNDNILSDGDRGFYYGGSGNDVMFSGIGGETMDGGTGIDLIDHTAFNGAYSFNMVTGYTNYSGERYTNFENVRMGGGNDTVTGNASANRIDGGAGNDTLRGGAEYDTLYGGTGNDWLFGGTGNDSLNGHTGNDRLYGGIGDDTYYIDAVDVVIERAGEGYDTVITSISTTLGANVERLSLQRTTNANGTGNTLDNTLLGNRGNNILRGLAGDDHLNGDGGADTLIGGIGNDTYYADRTDTIQELVGEGYDTVITGADRVTLSTHVERLILQGTGNISGFGNNQANTLVGNYSNNRLFGNAGNDYIQGTGGNNYLHGGRGNDTLVGANGNDILVGINGNDTLIGNGGADKFTFFRSTDGVDQIRDFSRSQGDKIEVLVQGFGGGLTRGVLASSQFVLGTSAQDANDRFIYNNGTLSFDVDGVGGVQAVQIATLVGNPALSYSDIVII